jgi:hypothetical protein
MRTSEPKSHIGSISCQCPSIPKFATSVPQNDANFGIGPLAWNVKFDRQGFALPIKMNRNNKFAELLCSGQRKSETFRKQESQA